MRLPYDLHPFLTQPRKANLLCQVGFLLLCPPTPTATFLASFHSVHPSLLTASTLHFLSIPPEPAPFKCHLTHGPQHPARQPVPPLVRPSCLTGHQALVTVSLNLYPVCSLDRSCYPSPSFSPCLSFTPSHLPAFFLLSRHPVTRSVVSSLLVLYTSAANKAHDPPWTCS